jgi:hypothetical protein
MKITQCAKFKRNSSSKFTKKVKSTQEAMKRKDSSSLKRWLDADLFTKKEKSRLRILRIFSKAGKLSSTFTKATFTTKFIETRQSLK